jgi:hypothetical protein
VQQTVECLDQVVRTYPALKSEASGKTAIDLERAIEAAQRIVASHVPGESLPPLATANALREAIAASPSSSAATMAKDILGPAENYGGKMSFRYVAPLALILAFIFGIFYFRERARGGYTVVKLSRTQADHSTG